MRRFKVTFDDGTVIEISCATWAEATDRALHMAVTGFNGIKSLKSIERL